MREALAPWVLWTWATSQPNVTFNELKETISWTERSVNVFSPKDQDEQGEQNLQGLKGLFTTRPDKTVSSLFSPLTGAYQTGGADKAAGALPGTLLSIFGTRGLFATARGAKARPNAIGFAPGAGRSALSNEGRLQHASRHLQEAAVLPGWKGKTSPELYRQKLAPILERPQGPFDDSLGGVPTKVFTGQIDGHDVALHVFKQGKHRGQIGTGVVPQGHQRAKWGFE